MPVIKTLTLLLMPIAIVAQQATGPANTQGNCSPANTGNSNTFTINCGIGREQGEQMLKILNRILDNRLDPAAVMGKLDEILSGVTKIEKSVKWRTLSVAQQEVLADACTAFAGRAISVFSFSGDPESAGLAQQIVAALSNARLRVQNRTGALLIVNGAPPAGLGISGLDPALAKAISGALSVAGIASSIAPVRPDEKEMTITVGTKPFDVVK